MIFNPLAGSSTNLCFQKWYNFPFNKVFKLSERQIHFVGSVGSLNNINDPIWKEILRPFKHRLGKGFIGVKSRLEENVVFYPMYRKNLGDDITPSKSYVNRAELVYKSTYKVAEINGEPGESLMPGGEYKGYKWKCSTGNKQATKNGYGSYLVRHEYASIQNLESDICKSIWPTDYEPHNLVARPRNIMISRTSKIAQYPSEFELGLAQERLDDSKKNEYYPLKKIANEIHNNNNEIPAFYVNVEDNDLCYREIIIEFNNQHRDVEEHTFLSDLYYKCAEANGFDFNTQLPTCPEGYDQEMTNCLNFIRNEPIQFDKNIAEIALDAIKAIAAEQRRENREIIAAFHDNNGNQEEGIVNGDDADNNNINNDNDLM